MGVKAKERQRIALALVRASLGCDQHETAAETTVLRRILLDDRRNLIDRFERNIDALRRTIE